MKYLVLINPSSCGGRALKRWQEYAGKIPDYDAVVLQDIEEAESRAREARGYSGVAATGGDGTVNAVANGVLQNPDENLKFGVLYAGTSPDFCMFHNIPVGTDAVPAMLNGNIKQIPVLTANGRAFFCSCNLGMGADTAGLANKLRPFLGDKIGTFCAAFWNILRSKKQTYTLNGEELQSCNHLLITRMPYIAGGLKLNLPDLNENEYAVWYLQDVSWFGWFKVICALYRGKSCGSFRICSGALHIDGAGKVEYDGDPHGTLPLDICFSARKLNLAGADYAGK